MAVIGHRSADWAEMMALWKGRIVEYGLWAAGGFAIGVGILPLIAALAVLARPREELRNPAIRAYVLVSGSALFFLGFYAGLKGGYISTKLGSYVVERNLIYLAPIAFVSTAFLLERRNPRWWAVGAATAFVLYLVVDVPLRIDQYPYYEAHGLAVLAFANRVLVWSEPTIQSVLIVVALVSCAALLAVGLVRGRRALAVLVAAVIGFTLGWNLLTEIYAANGERRLSHRLATNFVQPRDWVDTRRRGRDGDHRRTAVHRPQRRLADRVLQPLREEGLERRSHAAVRAGTAARPHGDGRSRRARRHHGPRAGHRLRAGRQRRPPAGRDRAAPRRTARRRCTGWTGRFAWPRTRPGSRATAGWGSGPRTTASTRATTGRASRA